MNLKIIFKIILILIIILLLPGLTSSPDFIDAIIILPNTTISSIYVTPIKIINDPINPFDNLTYFLQNDSTNNHKYIKGKYMCMDFSIDLSKNLTKNGYEAGIVLISNHAMVWVTMPEPYNTLHIEPQYDTIHDQFNNSKEISINHANRLRGEMYQYGQYETLKLSHGNLYILEN